MRLHRARRLHRAGGFTLIELLLVVAVIGILAAIALPGLMRARDRARGGHDRVAARDEYGACLVCRDLRRRVVSTGRRLAHQGADGIRRQGRRVPGPDFAPNPTNRQGYRIRFTAGPRELKSPASCSGVAADRGVQSYFIEASPLPANTGLKMRFFGTSSAATIFQSTVRVRAFYTGRAAAPARPIQ